MDFTDIGGINMKKSSFCYEMHKTFQNRRLETNTTPSKARYIVHTIRTFLEFEENYNGLNILDIMEETLTPYLNEIKSDVIYEAIIFILVNKKDKFKSVNDEKIKHHFGNCPFTIIQNLVELGMSLKTELPFDCINYVFKDKLHIKADEWNNVECSNKNLSEFISVSPPQYFYHQMTKTVKEEKQNQVFSMEFDSESLEKTDLLEMYYVKYSDKLPGFTFEEFYRTMNQILLSNNSNSELQNILFELLGFESLELISQLLEKRSEIIKELKLKEKQCDGTKNMTKQSRKQEKKDRKGNYNTSANGYNPSSSQNQPYEKWQDENLTLTRSFSKLAVKQYPHVHDEENDVKIKAMICGQVGNIPENAKKINKVTYDEIQIPSKPSIVSTKAMERLKVKDIDDIGQMIFKDIESFNIIQTEVFHTAYNKNENMLICAPTGAGKTNIALLSIVQQIKQYLIDGVVRLDKFKIVYICPMKALASEMTANFSKKLLPFGVTVKECTGDMQLTRKEISATQMLVTTPEKWDVITRKGTTDAELTSLLKLLIIDEVHLLNSDRGPVIEALVARTLRQVINSQNMIRIIGLSATLPNYIDVAHFLRVNPEVGLFYFDSRYRSVPLTQAFIGVKATKQIQQNIDMDEICFEKVAHFLREGHQVMVFVHSRNQTTKTASFFKETAQKKNLLHLFEPNQSFASKKATWNVNNKLLENFLPYGLGVHHAGMLRKDRNEVEKCFLAGSIKVLCCTATLAWGVNLPAHAVIIKGTKLYDSKKSSFVDLDILDVMQIFGRAGRPQFDTSGTGIIITTHDKMHFYLSSLTNQIPIESKLLQALPDNLNAEIVLGSVSSIQEAVEWMTFTYLYRRMRVNPQVYGLQYSDLINDPDLRAALVGFVDTAAKLLDKSKMTRYIPSTGDLIPTNLGRTSSYYYINFETINIFNELINPGMTEADIIGMMCLASEFQQIQVRQEELEDLEKLAHDYCFWDVPGGVENVHGKVNILMQTYLSRGYIKSLSLASDMEYITQSAARIARALFDIAIHQNKALLTGRCLLVAQMFEQRLWPEQTPMRQFVTLESTVLHNLEQYNIQVENILEMNEKEVGQAIRNTRLASKVKYCAESFPYVDLQSKLQPITMGVIRVKLEILPAFRWSTLIHGKGTEMFWIWIEDPENDNIYHTETFNVTKTACLKKEPIELAFTVPLTNPRPSQYLVRISNDRWMNAVQTYSLSFSDLHIPESFTPHTDLLELQPLEVSVLGNPLYESLYSFTHFNPIQTQIFHCLYHTDHNILLGAPTGSGKTIVAEICMFRLFNNHPHLKVVYIAPLKALVRERVDDWKNKFGKLLGKTVVEITGDITPSSSEITKSDIIITTPEKWDGMSRSWQTRNYIREVGLMIIDEIHLLGEDRGPVLEVIVSRTNFISDRTGRKLRIVGLSTAMANARDLATWLGIGEMGLYNFRPSVRPVPLEVHIQGFPGKHYCPRMLSMNRPAYQAIRQHAPESPTLIFCSSRKQTRLTAFDLITYLVTDAYPKQWLHCDENDMEILLNNLSDPDLKQFLSFGIGIHHAGLQETDRKTVEELFVNQKIQVLIATGTLAWGVNFPAHLVVIKGTEYFDGTIKRYVDMPITDVLQMMGRAGRPQFDTSGVACVFVHDIKKNFYKKFLYEPFPVESNLLQVLPEHINAEVVAETVPTKRSLMDYLTWTYLFRRLLENPSYYKLPGIEPQQINQYLSDLVDAVTTDLEESNCVSVFKNENEVLYESTFFGQIASYYYLSHKTMLHLQETLKCDNSIIDILWIMCQVKEYAFFPVRHNEDKINMELAKHYNFKLQEHGVDSPQVKVFIILNMYLSGFEMPNQEYIVDCKSILDQALRILQAMADISSNYGWASVTIRIIQLMQMIIQGRWITDSDILTINEIKTSSLSNLYEEFQKNELLSKINTLMGLKYASLKYDAILINSLINVFGLNVAEKIKKSLNYIPWIDIKYTIKNNYTNEVQSTKLIDMTAETQYSLVVEFRRRSKSNNLQVLSNKFTKKKEENWFLILAHNDELIAIKRITITRNTSTNLKLTAPSHIGNYIYRLYFISDSYVGLDQQYDIPIHIK